MTQFQACESLSCTYVAHFQRVQCSAAQAQRVFLSIQRSAFCVAAVSIRSLVTKLCGMPHRHREERPALTQKHEDVLQQLGASTYPALQRAVDAVHALKSGLASECKASARILKAPRSQALQSSRISVLQYASCQRSCIAFAEVQEMGQLVRGLSQLDATAQTPLPGAPTTPCLRSGIRNAVPTLAQLAALPQRAVLLTDGAHWFRNACTQDKRSLQHSAWMSRCFGQSVSGYSPTRLQR